MCSQVILSRMLSTYLKGYSSKLALHFYYVGGAGLTKYSLKRAQDSLTLATLARVKLQDPTFPIIQLN